MHKLWQTSEWQTATLEEVIAALFAPPPFLDPSDMQQINKYHPEAKAKYLSLFYDGKIPDAVKRINNV